MTISHRRSHLSAVILLLVLLSTSASLAATFTVTNLADSGPGSLRQAVLDANALPGADEVVFSPGLNGTITLTSGEIVITDSLVVAGPGAGALTVKADFHSRIFRVESPAAPAIDVTLSGLTLTRGFSGGLEGGVVLAYDENLTILDSVISKGVSGFEGTPPANGCGGNVAFIGSPEPPTETLRIVNSTLIDGTVRSFGMAWGGNLCVELGRLILERSTISGGSALDGWGGGIQLTSPAENSAILDSTISGNTAGSGGGIFVWAPRGNLNLRIESSTISGNSAEGDGGGISLLVASGSLLLRLTTVSNNSAIEGGGIMVHLNFLPGVQLDHSIVANGTPEDLADGIAAATVTANYSLIENPGEVLVSGANNLIGIDPLLGPLANNGGPTLTHHPLPGSPVIDSGNPAIPSPPATDQRGFARISGPAIDRGSVEVQAASAIAAIPTLSEWAILALSALLLAAGVWKLRAF